MQSAKHLSSGVPMAIFASCLYKREGPRPKTLCMLGAIELTALPILVYCQPLMVSAKWSLPLRALHRHIKADRHI